MTTTTLLNNLIPSTVDQQTYLFPKGLNVYVPQPIRCAPRSRSFAIETPGYYDALYATRVVTISSKNEDDLYTYVLRLKNGLHTHLSGNYFLNQILTPEGDPVFSDDLYDDESGQKWGWYGLDWYYDAAKEMYVPLRRMLFRPNYVPLKETP